jgi:hypothetical protein
VINKLSPWVVVLVLVLMIAWAAHGQSGRPPRQTWEYMRLEFDGNHSSLAPLGAEGWELVSIVCGHWGPYLGGATSKCVSYAAFLKRPK